MAIENDPSSRMQIRSMGQLQQPGSCYVCGNGTCELGFLDFGTFVDYHGSFYLCMLCARQAAETIGYFSPDEVSSSVGDKEELLAANRDLTAKLEEAHEHISSVNNLLQSKFLSSPVPSDSAVCESGADTEPDPDPFSGTVDGKSKSAKPVKGSQRSRVIRT